MLIVLQNQVFRHFRPRDMPLLKERASKSSSSSKWIGFEGRRETISPCTRIKYITAADFGYGSEACDLVSEPKKKLVFHVLMLKRMALLKRIGMDIFHFISCSMTFSPWKRSFEFQLARHHYTSSSVHSLNGSQVYWNCRLVFKVT